jgi:hypothetical protein
MAYILGLDLGQAATRSALCILEQSEPAAAAGEKPVRHYGCRALKRWPLGTSYPAILAEIASWVAAPPLRDGILILGATVAGRPVVDLFRRAKPAVSIYSVVITAGQGEVFTDGGYQVAKVHLISGVQVLLQQRRLRFAQLLPETPTLLKELHNYSFKPPPAPTEIYDPREGQDDDLVLSLALACWWWERRKLEFQWW